MAFQLYDTASRQIKPLVPVQPGRVSIYHCGLTVQGPPHIGHIRKEVVFDVLRRWLERSGYAVTIVANVTDIDDKILTKGVEQDRPWFAVAYENERALHAAYEVLGCVPPTYEPRATGVVPEMIEMMQTLIERGHAYAAEDGSGDVYFDVRSWSSYGELSNQKIDDMQAAEDAPPEGKRDARDFALWKGHKTGDPESASWPTPWGRGRPGWHLESSARSRLRSPPRWTTTSPCRRHWRSCRPRSARATSSWPRATPPIWLACWQAYVRCSTCSVWTHCPRRGTVEVTMRRTRR